MMHYPMVFRPILKERVWGGRSLAALGKRLPPGELIGESWEIADLPPEIEGGQSIVENGPLRGRSLRLVLEEDAEVILGAAAPTPRFPLLIKYLDAQQNLSVQVHPDRSYAMNHPDAHLKDEAWVVIQHQPGAVIYKGLRENLDESTLRAHVASGEIIDDLQPIEVRVGECHYLPSGTVHALGAGVLVAEIQTPSDTTYRLYDWGRSSRELHIDQALRVIFGNSSGMCTHAAPPQRAPGTPLVADHLRTTFLLEAECFNIERLDLLHDGEVPIVTNDLPEVWMVLEGSGEINGVVTVSLAKGMTVLIPARIGEAAATMREGTSILRVKLPSPQRGMIA